jgi:hypothetical protein
MLNNRFPAWRRAAGAAVLMAASLLPAAAQTYVPLPQSIIVFPFEKAESADQSVADTVVNGIRARLDHTPGYDATSFNPKSPLINRAIQSNELTQTQVAGPFDATSGAAVAKAAGVDNALVGSLEDASTDAASNSAKVTVTVQLVSARDAQVQKTAGVTGTATQAGIAPDALMRLAADDAAAKAVSQIFGTSNTGAAAVTGTAPNTGTAAVDTAPSTGTATTGNGINIPTAPAGLPTGAIPTEGRKKKNASGALIIGGLALLGLISASSGNGGGGGGGGNNGGGGPPVFPF